jgi:threonine synthase
LPLVKTEKSYTLECILCQKEWREEETCTTCLACGGALNVKMDLERIKKNLNRYSLEHAPLSAAKYLDFYPIEDRSKAVSLSEGDTPLYPIKKIGKRFGLPKLYVKNEGHNPTGVFKDRGSLVEISKALEMGAKAVCVASTGNMAASVAAYSSQAGLPCYIFVPEGTPIGKLSQTLSYGGKLIQVRGSYTDCVHLAEQLSEKHGYYLAGDYAFRLEGAKSTAFEIIEQLHWNVPDVVIVPVGCGTNLSGIWKGFDEFFRLGLTESVPQIIAVQPTGCDTICSAFHNKSDRCHIVEKPNTIASAVGIGSPLDDVKCLRALCDSKGEAETATDEEILDAQRMLAEKESIFTEPSGAIPIAVLPRLLEKGVISPLQTIVCVATGTGLKDPKAAISSFSEPTSVEADIDQIEHYLQSGIPTKKPGKADQDEGILFTKMPSEQTLQQTITSHFEYRPNETVLQNIRHDMSSLFHKGKEISKGDLLNIVEEAIENANIPDSPLKIKEFHLQDQYHDLAQGEIVILFLGEEQTQSATGVGPVDALIKAMQKAVSAKTDFWPELSDFNVDVATSKESALVKVRMEMKDAEGNQVIAKASSSDIIVASLNAFMKGFNLLYERKPEE